MTSYQWSVVDTSENHYVSLRVFMTNGSTGVCFASYNNNDNNNNNNNNITFYYAIRDILHKQCPIHMAPTCLSGSVYNLHAVNIGLLLYVRRG